jgi:ribonuclease P protein component
MLTRDTRVPKKLFPLLKKNKLFEGEFFSLRVTYGVISGVRAVCIVSKKVSKMAVQRNKIKRQVYSILVPLLNKSSKNCIIQIFPKKTSVEKNYPLLEEDIKKIISTHNIL